jgi:exodeoxyribonuclease V alpha subunit
MAGPIDVHHVFAQYFQGIEPLAYAVSKTLEEGSICLDLEKYKQELMAKEHPEEVNPFWIHSENFDQLSEEGKFVTGLGTILKPFVKQNGKVYLHRYFQYETQIIENIKRLGNHFKIITGGPGTGKTYSLAIKLVELYGMNMDLMVALAAPTGKAAVRMNESIRQFSEKPENKINPIIHEKLTRLKAQTIHRLLGSVKDSVFFKYNEDNKLPYDVVIIDEASMIDSALMAKLMNALDHQTQFFLLGDKDQLSSVEAGSIFGDLCRAKDSFLLKAKVEEKHESRRFSIEKGIGKLSKAIIEGKENETIHFDRDDEQIEIDYGFSKQRFEIYASGYFDYIHEADIKESLKKLNHIRFLCAVREGEQGMEAINKKIERYLASGIKDKSKFDPKPGIYHNQPIIVTQNNYNLDIFNGDVGIIRKEGEHLYAWFENPDGEIRKIQAAYLNHFETVFAMTIHKSQGSEFDHVAVVLPISHGSKILSRELLYTAVTRAKTKVLIQTSEDTLRTCVSRQVARASGIEERLKIGF